MNLTRLRQLSFFGELFFQNTPIISGAAFQQLPKYGVVNFSGGDDAAAGLLAWQNPESVPILITRAGVNVETPSTAACTVSLGTAATPGLSANLMTGYSIAAAGAQTNLSAPGASGKADQVLPAGEYVTLSTASGASAGAVGQVVFEYILLA